ncbi:MAG: MscL family protein [Gemmatimonadota bacterium]
MISDFRQFLLKANVVGLALAVIVGGAAGALVTAMVDDFVMPIIAAVTPGGNWREWALTVGPMKFGVGHFLGVFLNFAIVSFVAWRLGLIFIKPEPAVPVKSCPFCRNSIPPDATRCGFCTSAL